MDFAKLGHACVVGLHWGDEGKGKIVDLLSEHFDVVVRYNGGGNAGHTVWIGGEKFALHLLPVGVLSPGKTAVIGPGVALDLPRMLEELVTLKERGIDVGDALKISNRAHLVMPYHKKQDSLSESSLGDKKIGTTARGIGPCYADEMQRATAIRVTDLFNPESFRERVARIVDRKNKVFAALWNDAEPLDAKALADEYLGYAKQVRDNVCDTTQYLHEQIQGGRRLLFEGANGALLDIDHGTFPFVTSSTTSAIGIPAGAGVPPQTLQACIGVTKSYTTRVGAGPFPTEHHDEIGQKIRDRGHEYGTTTGRPRRCGWFDAVAARYTIRLSGITHVAVMHLDTLGTFDRVGICTGYRVGGKVLDTFVADANVLESVEPVIEFMPGWHEDLSKARSIDDLPKTARDYLDRVESLIEAPITIVSVGPERTQTLFRA